MTSSPGPPRASLAPSSSYRVQLRPSFDLAAAADIVSYLQELGVSHLYASPYLQATPGSSHGYDIVDPHQVSVDLGGAEQLARLRGELAAAGMSELLDTVPNHLAVGGRENRWWWDVLARGEASPYASYFDIDWDQPAPTLSHRLLVPVLRGHYGQLLERGEIQLVRGPEAVEVAYRSWRWPISPDSLSHLVHRAQRLAGPAAGDHGPIADRSGDGAPLGPPMPVALATAGGAGFDEALAELLRQLNRDPRALDEILHLQHYQLGHWGTANGSLNYRRFFDISTLAGLRVEAPAVFADRHRLLLGWLRSGEVAALRVDHIDGLHDPLGYLSRLRQASPGAWILTEKILAPGERLPPSWPVDGTTGYDFLRLAGGVLLNRRAESAMTDLYSSFTGETEDFATISRRTKRWVLDRTLASELERLTGRLAGICAHDRRGRDYSRPELRAALLELAASFPTYRTYVSPEQAEVDGESAAQIQAAVTAAAAWHPGRELLGLLQDLLLRSAPHRPERELLVRLQQLTGPVMAKGVEDTAFYRYFRLISLNEVGDDPGRFGVSVEEFHHAMAERQARWPRSLNATSTHDTKRSEDVRARIHLLAEIPEFWGSTVRRWAAGNERHRRDDMPSRNDEYYLYQTLVGAWPIARERLLPALVKSAREAKTHTSWQSPNPHYERALVGFADRCLGDPRFRAELEGFVAGLVGPGRVNSLAQTLIKLTAPGVPDIYQGTELWDHSLVDPDNRRAVDYDRRRRLLAELAAGPPRDLRARWESGLPKLWVIKAALKVRRDMPEPFGPQGSYLPMRALGAGSDQVLAFARGDRVVTVAQRLPLSPGKSSGRTVVGLPRGRWRSQLDGREFPGGDVDITDLLATLPVALLVRQPS